MKNKRENEKQRENRKQQLAGKEQIAERMQQNYRMWEQMGYGPVCEISMEQIALAASEGLQKSLQKREDKQQILNEPKCLERYLQNYEAACQCYYLYRDLHERTDHDTKTAVLLGDYFFGEFSHYLIPIDSPKLIDLFSERLRKETEQVILENKQAAYRNLEEYTAFVKRIPEQFVEELA